MRQDDQNIGSWLRHHGELDGDKAAIVFEDEGPIIYRQLDLWVDAAAAKLSSEYGIEKGARVAYLGINDPAVIVLLFACARLGAILVPINWRLAAAEVSYIVTDCAPIVVFHSLEFAENRQ